MQPYEKVSKLRKKDIIVNNFIGGLAWGIGSTVGLAIFLYMMTFILGKINLTPIVGNFVSDVQQYIKTNKQ